MGDWRWSGSIVWMVMMMKITQGLTGDGVTLIEIPTQICKEESKELLFTNNVYYFAGTHEGVGFYVLAKPIMVVLASLMLIPLGVASA